MEAHFTPRFVKFWLFDPIYRFAYLLRTVLRGDLAGERSESRDGEGRKFHQFRFDECGTGSKEWVDRIGG